MENRCCTSLTSGVPNVSEDVFKVREVLVLQQKVIDILETTGPDDVAVKIAALRAAADLLQQTVNMAMITASFKSLMGGRG